MPDTLDPNTVDKRTWERYARSGQLDAKAFKKSLETLPDVAEKAATVSTVMFEDEELDDDMDDDDTQDVPEGALPDGQA